MPMHGPAHYDFSCEDFVKEDMFFERTKNEKEAPVAQPMVSKATAWPKRRVLAEELAGRLHGVEVKISQFPASVEHISFNLPFNVGDEVVRLTDVPVAEDWSGFALVPGCC
jgi:hypothetical protein